MKNKTKNKSNGIERRDFIKAATLSGVALSLGNNKILANKMMSPSDTNHKFNLKYAPHFGMFKNNAGKDYIDQLKFMAENGFSAIEDNGMKGKSIDDQNKIAAEMTRLGISMGVFVANNIYWKEPNLASGKQDYRDEFLNDIKDSVEVAKRVNAKWMTVVPGHVDLRLEFDYQTANVVESLKQASAILEPHGLVMVLEPLNFFNHPGLFLTKIPQAYQICKAVDSPSCKILDDLYHQQVTEGNLIPNIDNAWDEIAYFQIGDNPGRKEPTTGEVNYKNVFEHIHKKGFKGILGMEHGNSNKGKSGEMDVIEAYKKCDNF
ncbi:MAG: TIM barrel protein [Ignavibacteriae bacterium]|nr:TIM barrel protein [Ignavibacteriota bacterium]